MKRITILNFFPAFTPPRSGGELRYWHLATALAEKFDVRMFNPTYPDHQREVVRHGPRCVELRLPKTKRYLTWHHLLGRFAKFSECSALVSTLAGPSHAALVREATRAAARSHVVIHSCPFLYNVHPRVRGRQLLVYDSYNVEARLAREMFGEGIWGRWASGRVKRIEGALARNAHVILACSREDADEMAALYKIDHSKIVVIPNGVDVEAIRPPASREHREQARSRLGLAGERPALFFIGSFHPPNLDAVEFILTHLAHQLPGAEFLVAGKVCQAFEHRSIPGNVRLMGLIDESVKHDLLAGADIALNPMITGSGTNLKMLDFFAAGLPVVTTPVGARGLEVEHHRHAMVVEKSRMLGCVEELLSDARLRKRLGDSARELAVKRFSWQVIGDEARNLIDIKSSRRLIVLNDFPMTPVDLGGKARMDAVARSLAANVAPVTCLCFTREEKGRHVSITPRLEELNVPRSWIHKELDRILSHFAGVGADDVCALLFSWTSPMYRHALRREIRSARAVVFCHPYLLGEVRKYAGRVPLVHESYNVETKLKEQLYKPNFFGRFLKRAVRRAEREALHLANLTTCVAREDAADFVKLFSAKESRIVVAENGVDCTRMEPLPPDSRRRVRAAIGIGPEPMVVFLASGHPPNAKAARFIVDEVAPRNPECTIFFVGSVCGWFYNQSIPDNVIMLGVVSTETKEFLLQTADIALNPVEQGSGTSLKIMEYMSAGLPVISTAVGARGVAEADCDQMILCRLDEFPDALRKLIADPALQTELAQRGRKLALERFDWKITLRGLCSSIARVADCPVRPNASIPLPAPPEPEKALVP